MTQDTLTRTPDPEPERGRAPSLLTRSASAADDAHHVLAGWHDYAAHAAMFGPSIAEEVSGSSLAGHAARLAAALGDVLADHAGLRVIAAELPGLRPPF